MENKIQIVDESFVNHWAPEITNEQHHADKTAIGSSGVRTFIKETPAHFYAKHLSPDAEPVTSEALRIGSLVHMALLEPSLFLQRYRMVPNFGSKRTNKYKEEYAKWTAKQSADSVFLEKDDYHLITGIVQKVLNNPVAKGTISGGVPERSGYFRDPETGVKCKIRPDVVNMLDIGGTPKHALIDFKTARSAKMMDFFRAIGRYRYDVQMAFYCDGYKAITGHDVDYPLFLVAEKEPPYACAIYQLSKSALEAGRRDYKLALQTLKVCIETERWPAYDDQVREIEVPYWSLSNQDESEI